MLQDGCKHDLDVDVWEQLTWNLVPLWLRWLQHDGCWLHGERVTVRLQDTKRHCGAINYSCEVVTPATRRNYIPAKSEHGTDKLIYGDNNHGHVLTPT